MIAPYLISTWWLTHSPSDLYWSSYLYSIGPLIAWWHQQINLFCLFFFLASLMTSCSRSISFHHCLIDRSDLIWSSLFLSLSTITITTLWSPPARLLDPILHHWSILYFAVPLDHPCVWQKSSQTCRYLYIMYGIRQHSFIHIQTFADNAFEGGNMVLHYVMPFLVCIVVVGAINATMFMATRLYNISICFCWRFLLFGFSFAINLKNTRFFLFLC